VSRIVEGVVNFGTLLSSSVHNSTTTNSIQIKFSHEILDIYKNGLI